MWISIKTHQPKLLKGPVTNVELNFCTDLPFCLHSRIREFSRETGIWDLVTTLGCIRKLSKTWTLLGVPDKGFNCNKQLHSSGGVELPGRGGGFVFAAANDSTALSVQLSCQSKWKAHGMMIGHYAFHLQADPEIPI